MIIEHTIEVPADHRIFLELPRSVPVGVKARIEISIPAIPTIDQAGFYSAPSAKIEEVRQLLKEEMAEKGTSAVLAASGDGWEAQARERYAEH